MDYKDLFSRNKQTTTVSKFLRKSAVGTLGDGIESGAHLSASIDKREAWIPHVDYSNPYEFVRYGSAEKYYLDTFDQIRDEYPYDGSAFEKVDFYNHLNPLEKYIYDVRYPKSTGYITIGADYGTVGVDPSGNGYL